MDNGVPKNQKSDKQKELEKRQKKINRRVRLGKGFKTGGFRFGKKIGDVEETVSVKESANKSMKDTEKGKNDAQVQAAIDKMKPSSKRIALKRTPATLGNTNLVGKKPNG